MTESIINSKELISINYNIKIGSGTFANVYLCEFIKNFNNYNL